VRRVGHNVAAEINVMGRLRVRAARTWSRFTRSASFRRASYSSLGLCNDVHRAGHGRSA